MSEATKKQVAEEAAEIAAETKAVAEADAKENKEKSKAKAKEVVSLQLDKNGRKVPAEYGESTTVIVPIDKENKHLKTVPVKINEYEWDVPRGKPVKVPAAVLNVLRYAGYFE